MTDNSGRSTQPRQAHTARQGLASLGDHAQALKARLRLLWEDVASLGHVDHAERSALIVQANEQLVLAALRADAVAEWARNELDELARTAQRDELTGTPNRALLLDRMQHAIAQARRHDASFALLFVDLDHFKYINDALGHAIGDEVLRQVARRLESAVRSTDTVSRYGGDEFLVLLAETTHPEDAGATADKVLAALAEPLVVEGNSFELSASIGISLYPRDDATPLGLIAKADEAMYAAKRHQPGHRTFYRPSDAGLPETAAPAGLAARSNGDASASPALYPQQIAFLATVVHELRNPLAPLRNAAELLVAAHADEARLRQLKAIIVRQVARMDRLVGDLLQIARGSTGKFHLQYSSVDMHEMYMTAIEACRPAMELRQQTLALNIPAGIPEVRGDAVRLAQVFGNLLDNASRYTPAGGSITFDAAVGESEIVTVIADSGIGISADVLPSIFDLFVQETRAAGSNAGGLGIGLSVVRDLVNAHGGTVTASSKGQHQGSAFTVSLPRGKGDANVGSGLAAN